MSSHFSAFPNEIYIMITNEVFNSPTPGPSSSHSRYDVDNSLHLALRVQRLGWLRSLARVCKAWAHPVRTAFWKEVTVFTIQELTALARAVEDTTAKPACIRRLYLRSVHVSLENYYSPNLPEVVEEARCSLVVILHQLSAHLDVFHLSCDTKHSLPGSILYKSLCAACQDHTFSIDVTKLTIQSPSNVLQAITFVRNVVHLVLAFDGGLRESDTSLPSFHLEFLVLQMNFSSSYGIALAARAVANMLEPACETLKSLTLDFYGYDDTTQSERTEAIKYVLSLKGPSTSVLNLCAKPFYPLLIAQELADADVFPPYPSLRYLHLDEFGVCPDIFRQLCCYGLRQLHITVTETETPSARDWVETMEGILTGIKLNELDNLNDLVVDFNKVTGYDEDTARRTTVSRWMDKEPAWEPLETACATRSITCAIRHPE